MLIFATTSHRDFIDDCDLLECFDYKFTLNDLESVENKAFVLQTQAGFQDETLAKRCATGVPGGIGIKKLIQAAELANFRARKEGVDAEQALLENLVLM